jgi:hypothetical protein
MKSAELIERIVSSDRIQDFVLVQQLTQHVPKASKTFGVIFLPQGSASSIRTEEVKSRSKVAASDAVCLSWPKANTAVRIFRNASRTPSQHMRLNVGIVVARRDLRVFWRIPPAKVGVYLAIGMSFCMHLRTAVT